MKTKLLTLTILLMMTGYLFAGGFALSGVGARAMSMGGAFRGMADDNTALYWNPAGIAFISSNSATIGVAGIIPTSDYTPENAAPGMPVKKYKAEEKTWAFPSVYTSMKGTPKLNFALGVYVPYGLGANWDMYSLPTTMPISATISLPVSWSADVPDNQIISSIGIVDIHPTVSYKFSDKFAFGAGLSAQYGMIEIQKLVPHATNSFYTPTIFDLDGNGWGFGANMGFLYKMNDRIQFGLSGKLPSVISLEGDATYDTYLNNVVAASLGIPAATVLHAKTTGQADLNLPGDIGIGVSFRSTPNWVWNLDYSYTTWSHLDKVLIEIPSGVMLGTTELTDREMILDWKDTNRISVGTEYTMNQLALRAGFFYDESPIPEKSLNPTWPDVSSKYSGNIGVGYQFGRFNVDTHYEHIFFDERTINIATTESWTGKYNTSIDAFNLSLTYKF